MSLVSEMKEYLQPGVIGLMTVVIGYLFTKRASNSVNHANRRADRESRFEDNLQKRLDDALTRADRLADERQQARDALALAQRAVKERDQRIRALLGTMSPDERRLAERWMPESAFMPFADTPSDPKGKK